MGVDIYLKSGKADFSCRLYWISDLIDEYWQNENQPPEFQLDKKLSLKEIKQLLDFFKPCLQKLQNDKEKQIAKFDSAYFKKIETVNSSLKNLIKLVKSKPVDKSIAFKLQGLVKKLGHFINTYSTDPNQEKAEIKESFNEKISLVQKIIPFLTKIASGRGSVTIS